MGVRTPLSSVRSQMTDFLFGIFYEFSRFIVKKRPSAEFFASNFETLQVSSRKTRRRCRFFASR